jgi:TldD protein
LDSEKIKEIVKATVSGFKQGYLIVRAQKHREISLRYNNGQIESLFTGDESGMGVQAFTPEGASGFASGNVLSLERAEELAQKALKFAYLNQGIDCERNTNIFTVEPTVADVPSLAKFSFDHFSPAELQQIVSEIHNRLLTIKIEAGSVAWQTVYRQLEDFWCIGRTDGTLVSFTVPRAVLLHQGTVRDDGYGQSFSVKRSGVDGEILLAEQADRSLHLQAEDKARFIHRVCKAPQIPTGSYPLVIDYGLAKGLAHEAFGHAVESDLLEESVLGLEGKLRTGMVISKSGVDIIDGPLERDWAYQPYSANGQIRKTVAIVKDGVLQQGLGDIFSAAKAGMEITDAARVEYFGSVPLPRMTNIRLLVKDNIPLSNTKNLDQDIKNIREALLSRGMLAEDYHFLLLGYCGGQVNSRTGDFVFQCDGAVNLADPELTVYQAGIFSGKILAVLEAVNYSLGSAQYDAIGTCGKAGQMVPSSGGGSGYIMLEKNENVKIGGSAND